ncbi:DUF945 family protein [Burkholderiaceae bacterium UC74_6]
MNTSRRALTIVAVLAVAWVAAAAYTKHKVGQSYRDEIAQLEKQLPMLHVSELKQEGGLLSGTYSGVIHVGCAPVDGKPNAKSFAIAFQDRVQYGPLPGFKRFGAASVDSSFSLTDAAPQALRTALAKIEPARIHTDYGYGGSVSSSFILPAGELQMADPMAKVSLRWAETRMDMQGTRDKEHIVYTWALPDFNMGVGTGEGRSLMEMHIKNLMAKSDTHGRAGSWLRTGQEESSLELFEITSVAAGPDQPPINVVYNRLTGKTTATLQQDLMDVQFGYTLASLQAGNAGPFAKLANVDMQGKLSRLHGPSLEKAITALFSGLDGACAMDSGAAGAARPDVFVKGMVERLGESLKGVMAQGPVFSIDKLAFDLDGKRGEMSMSASLQGVDMDALWKGGPQAKQVLQQGAKLQAKARVPLGWLTLAGGTPEQVEQTVAGIVAQGMAERDGEFLKTEFSFAGGVAKINGVPMPMPQTQAQATQ